MGAVKLLAFDLDGTTITEHKYLSPGNREALIKAQAAGVELVPATGRMKTFLPQEILDLPGVRYAITANGAAVYDLREDKPVYQRLIPNEKARQVQQVLDRLGHLYRVLQPGHRHHQGGLPRAGQDPLRPAPPPNGTLSRIRTTAWWRTSAPCSGRRACARRRSTCPTWPRRRPTKSCGRSWRPWAACG